MISKHSHEQSSDGEGVEVIINEPYEDPIHGKGQYTEKRVYLNRCAIKHLMLMNLPVFLPFSHFTWLFCPIFTVLFHIQMWWCSSSKWLIPAQPPSVLRLIAHCRPQSGGKYSAASMNLRYGVF